MPGPILLDSKPQILFLLLFIVLWAIWCVFSVETLVPLIERHVVIYYGLAAWLLCILPVVATAIFVLVGISKADE